MLDISELVPVVLTNTEEVKETNRYYLSSVYKTDNNKFFETWDIPYIPKSSEDKFHTILTGEEGRWDLISYKYYETVSYWWIVCVANNIRNPLQILPAGSVLRIPNLKTIYDITVLRKTEEAEYSRY